MTYNVFGGTLSLTQSIDFELRWTTPLTNGCRNNDMILQLHGSLRSQSLFQFVRISDAY